MSVPWDWVFVGFMLAMTVVVAVLAWRAPWNDGETTKPEPPYQPRHAKPPVDKGDDSDAWT